MSDRDMLEPQGITSSELKLLVDEYVTAGGKIKQCAEGVALNFRLSVLDPVEEPKKIRVIKNSKKTGKNSKK